MDRPPSHEFPDRAIQDQLSRKERELEAVRRISLSLFQHLRLEDLVKRALSTALEVVNAEAGSVLLADPSTKELVFAYSIGLRPVPKGTSIPYDRGIAGSVFKTGEPEMVSDVETDSRHFAFIDLSTGLKTRELIAIPLKRWEGEPIGVMEVLNKRNGRLDAEDLALLTIVGAFTAIAIEGARLFQEAKLAEVAKLLGDIGHDIKNMVMPITNGASLLQDELKEHFAELPARDTDEVRACQSLTTEITDMIARNARRLQERVREIADAVKGVTSPPRFAPCKIAKVTEEVLGTLRVYSQDQGVTLHCEGLDALPAIQADERRLFNALYNLINNAIPEVPRGGTVTIRGSLDSSGEHIHLSVADTGKGMPQDVRDSILSGRAISTKAGGTGLGTKIVKDVVDAHGGAVHVESEEGAGTTFFLDLPVKGPSSTA